jgi:hypothetical protein
MQEGLLLEILVLSASIAISGCATTTTVSQEAAPGTTLKTDAPLPGAMSIIAPGPDIPTEMAAFSGKWFGKWLWATWGGGNRDHILIVEEIRSPSEVIVIYSYGSCRGTYKGKRTEPGWRREMGRFVDNNTLQLSLGGRSATYRMRKDGSLDAAWASADVGDVKATMKRIE